MNAYSNAYNTYKNNSVNFASKEQLLLMLLEGAVKFTKIARQAIMDKEVKKAHENLIKTQDIFSELMITLDVEKGGEWAPVLFNIYDYIKQRLIEANIKKDIQIIDEIMPLIEEVKDTWTQAHERAKGAK